MRQEFTQEIKDLVHDIMEEMHTALIGRVVAFDTDKCEVDVQPIGRIKTNSGYIDYPTLYRVPVFFMQGGGAAITYPVKNGDNCLLLFSEQTLEAWRNDTASTTDLKHDLNNAIALVGMSRIPSRSVKEATERDAVIIDRNGMKIIVNPSGVDIVGNVTVNGNLTVSGALIGGSHAH